MPTDEQPGSALLVSPVVAHANRILIFGTMAGGMPCVHAVLLDRRRAARVVLFAAVAGG